MSQLLIAHIGSYPRIGEEKDQQRYRRALGHLQRKEISEHAFRDVTQSITQEIIREQLAAGLDEVTDGLVSWNDPISHVCARMQGFRIGGLARYFDTNFYYRTPVIVSKPKRNRPLVLPEFEFAKQVSNRPVRVVLTGPYTLAVHTRSESKGFDKLQNRVSFFTEALRAEIEALVLAGATLIQIDEPALALSPEHLKVVEKSTATLTQNLPSARFSLAVYFSPLAPLYDALQNFAVHTLHLDFTYDHRRLFETMMKNPPKIAVGFGVLNARNTRLEPIDPIIKAIHEWTEAYRPAVTYLTPSAGLEFLPRETAFAKLKLLSMIRSEINLSLEMNPAHAP